MIDITAIGSNDIGKVWNRVVGNTRKCLRVQKKYNALYKGTHTESETLEHLKCGNGLLLVIHDNTKIFGSLIVEVINTEAGRSLNLTGMGGTEIMSWRMKLLDALITLARNYNCEDMRIYIVRPGWIRALKPYGFKVIGRRTYGENKFPVLARSIV